MVTENCPLPVNVQNSETEARCSQSKTDIVLATPSVPLPFADRHHCRRTAVFLGLLSLPILMCTSVTPAREAADWSAALAHGHAQGDSKPLAEFLEHWHKVSEPIAEDVVRKKLVLEQSIYELYKAFYKPPTRHYRDCAYVIVQNSIEVVLMDSDLEDVLRNTWEILPRDTFPSQVSRFELKEFRPSLQLDGKHILYLDPFHLASMLGFLTDRDGYLVEGTGWSEDSESPDRMRRLEYLNSMLQIFPGHWGRGWHFETHPYVKTIFLSFDQQRAIVQFRVYYGGGEASMERLNGRWQLTGILWTFAE